MKLKSQRLIAPISCSRMGSGQSPLSLMQAFSHTLLPLIGTPDNDVDIVLTTGLYLNNAGDDVLKARRGLLQQAGQWRQQFNRLLIHEAAAKRPDGFEIVPSAFQITNWDDQLTADWGSFESADARLRKWYDTRPDFRACIDNGLQAAGRAVTPRHLAFVFEEASATALWLKQKVGSPLRLRSANKDDGVYIVYPGKPPAFMLAGLDLILKGQNDILPLVWIDTSGSEPGIETYRFGRHLKPVLPSSRPA